MNLISQILAIRFVELLNNAEVANLNSDNIKLVYRKFFKEEPPEGLAQEVLSAWEIGADKYINGKLKKISKYYMPGSYCLDGLRCNYFVKFPGSSKARFKGKKCT